ncbi:MAG: hypothetical protein HYU68_13180 [Bacteroidetes bacterium]|nr:hypothetical protein [Bacteroidota bacterium]
MQFDPFEIVGIWKLTSEKSDELISFQPDGTYRIYYEVPFRLIEIGEWQIMKNKLMLFYCNTKISCKINFLKGNKLEFLHLSDSKSVIKDNYEKINHLNILSTT